MTVVGIRLLSTQEDFAKLVSIDEFSAYIKAVNSIATSVFSTAKSKADIIIQFTSTSTGTEPNIVYQGEVENKFLQDFHDQVTKLKPPKVMRDQLRYQVEYKLNP